MGLIDNIVDLETFCIVAHGPILLPLSFALDVITQRYLETLRSSKFLDVAFF